jgi:integrase
LSRKGLGLGTRESEVSREGEAPAEPRGKDLRKTCATYHDQNVPELSIEILGHSVGGITDRHYAHRAPLASKSGRALHR